MLCLVKFPFYGPVGSNSVLRNLTWQVEECVKDIKALRIISLDELVWVPFTDLRAENKKT